MKISACMWAIVFNVFVSACAFSLLPGVAATATAQDAIAEDTRNVFQMPRFADEQRRHTIAVLKLFKRQRYSEAEQALRNLIRRFPDWPMHHFGLAVALARQDQTDDALDSLELAIDKGFDIRKAMETGPLLNTLWGLPRFQALIERRKSAAPLRHPGTQLPHAKQVEKGLAVVDETNTMWDANSNTLVSAFAFSDRPRNEQVRGGDDAISRRLNLLYGRRKAAGNHGDLYDNRDDGHSRLRPRTYPQLSHIKYSAEAMAARVHYGVNAHQLFNAITIGNSSTALRGGTKARSLARFIQTNPVLMASTFQHYVNDHLYVFPGVGDYNRGVKDRFPANTPYMLVSQGASRTDQPILRALAAILAAFDPSVKAYLRSKHLIMPTVQMIFRFSQKSVTSTNEYLTGKAHPPVFDGNDLDVRKMIFLANNLRKEEVPPRVDLKVIQETIPKPGITYFGPNAADEVLFTTPSAIARIIRSTDMEKRMVISTSGTVDPNGHPLKFEWRVLQGDSNLINIERLKQDGSEIDLEVRWPASRSRVSNPALASNRVDIAVFAHNGFNYSAPAFISLSYPTRQRRVYDRAGRIQTITYDPQETRNIYQDPVLFPRRGWRDLYAYTKDGKFIGWDRVTKNSIENYTRDGARVTKKDDLGRAVEAERVIYTIKPGMREVVAVPTGEMLVYRYKDKNDRIGISSKVTGE